MQQNTLRKTGKRCPSFLYFWDWIRIQSILKKFKLNIKPFGADRRVFFIFLSTATQLNIYPYLLLNPDIIAK
jgi:hypothetical protein